MLQNFRRKVQQTSQSWNYVKHSLPTLKKGNGNSFGKDNLIHAHETFCSKQPLTETTTTPSLHVIWSWHQIQSVANKNSPKLQLNQQQFYNTPPCTPYAVLCIVCSIHLLYVIWCLTITTVTKRITHGYMVSKQCLRRERHISIISVSKQHKIGWSYNEKANVNRYRLVVFSCQLI